jgi:hypothetical protein
MISARRAREADLDKGVFLFLRRAQSIGGRRHIPEPSYPVNSTYAVIFEARGDDQWKQRLVRPQGSALLESKAFAGGNDRK